MDKVIKVKGSKGVELSTRYTAKEAMKPAIELIKSKKDCLIETVTADMLVESEILLFAKMFMKFLHKNHASVFLLADNQERLGQLRSMLGKEYGKIKVVETATFEEHGVSDDVILNRINGVEKHCILVALPLAEQKEFLEANKLSLNAKIWFGLGVELLEAGKKSIFQQVKNFVMRKNFKTTK